MKQYLAKGGIILSLLVAFAFTSNGPAAVNERLLKAFSLAYPKAEKIIWVEDKGDFIVHFMDGDVRSVLEYNSDGDLLGSLRYFSNPALLPSNVSWQWHHRYPGKTLYGVTEASNGDNTVWFLKLEDEDQWLTLKVGADGVIQQFEKLKKQK